MPGLTEQTRILITADAVGGVWRYALTLAQGFAARGIGTVLAVLGPSPDGEQRAECAAITGLHLVDTGQTLDWTASHPGELTQATECLAGLAEQSGVAAVHLHAPALVGTARWPVPVVVVAHSCVATWWEAVRGGPLPEDFAWRTTMTGDGLHAADEVIAPSAAHAAALRRTYGAVDAHVVHNGGKPSSSTSAKSRAVLTAGRLWDEGKGVVALDRAAAGLSVPVRAAGPTCGPNGAQVTFAHLTVLGPLAPEALADQYAAANVFASLAHYEPFGLAVLEAAQAECALVLSDIPTFRELWDGAAVFVPSGADPAPFLLRALDDPGLGRAARTRATRYSADAMVDGTLAVHRMLVPA